MSNDKNPNETKKNPNEGGREAITRLIEAYGYTSRQQLCDHLGISKSTLANRWLRDTFPFDWVIQCSIETKASLTWLMTGNGQAFDPKDSDVVRVNNIKLIGGIPHPASHTLFDLSFLMSDLKKPIQLIESNSKYILETSFTDITDGLWLVEIDGITSLKKISRIPNKKIRISDDQITFECSVDDVKAIGRVAMTISYS
ncbi:MULTISPECIES: phage repressor protein CI [unclassified Symbiopectobacterium]|uniref:phage repressor protein CI n=1 Tax=unclassified Symbiopectobacterium TaxID=2794573 RepID=UPI0022264B6C|nr:MULTISPECIES: phage repressor protein CI [unclassified Symbiopectobacterium]MCW2474690.1 phage repressor protein CI [Candidatus Symbiopectobacterium sp. NZEC151]MCW2482078.1 phage repressor protein CI [Candidatus Symbiopectobacterium sp. NZEC135]